MKLASQCFLFALASVPLISASPLAPRALTCGVEQCLSNGTFYGCSATRPDCICKQDQSRVDEYLIDIKPCLGNTGVGGCTEGGWYEFKRILKDVCEHFGKIADL
ncbi:hypothetical protein EJ04DRAFT_523437 [Polyplosphaeria fusca]|uniref:Extracellular membrane protein CFEM domain-containing protein n=1 Tax=Polyplosphaeria fusca TaxID=682080 RepID=A0A9P4R0U2_9PLEO|nr:hypothetical protein EJ04DRAFT_523437 [Polyplosphaeria fusca]